MEGGRRWWGGVRVRVGWRRAGPCGGGEKREGNEAAALGGSRPSRGAPWFLFNRTASVGRSKSKANSRVVVVTTKPASRWKRTKTTYNAELCTGFIDRILLLLSFFIVTFLSNNGRVHLRLQISKFAGACVCVCDLHARKHKTFSTLYPSPSQTTINQTPPTIH